MTKTTIRTVLNNVTELKDGTFSYNEELVWSKWIAEPNTKPHTLVEVIQEHLSDDLNTRNSSSQIEIPSDQPTDEEGVQ